LLIISFKIRFEIPSTFKQGPATMIKKKEENTPELLASISSSNPFGIRDLVLGGDSPSLFSEVAYLEKPTRPASNLELCAGGEDDLSEKI
jgi:hypothetical protein